MWILLFSVSVKISLQLYNNCCLREDIHSSCIYSLIRSVNTRQNPCLHDIYIPVEQVDNMPISKYIGFIVKFLFMNNWCRWSLVEFLKTISNIHCIALGPCSTQVFFTALHHSQRVGRNSKREKQRGKLWGLYEFVLISEELVIPLPCLHLTTSSWSGDGRSREPWKDLNEDNWG